MKARSLHRRFLWAMACATCVMGTLAALLVYRLAQDYLHATGLATVQATMHAIENTAAAGAYAKDQSLLLEIADGLNRHPYVAAVHVRDAEGRVLLSASKSGEPHTPADDAHAAQDAPFTHNLVSPFDAHETIGQLQVWPDHQKLTQEAQRQAQVLVVALALLLLGFLLVFNGLAMRLLSRPMYRLAHDLAAIEPGTDARIAADPSHRGDEIGIVREAANRLLELQESALNRERAMHAEIALMEARYRGIFDSTSAGIFVTSAHGRLIHGNPALGRLLGAPTGVLPQGVQANLVRSVVRDPQVIENLIRQARHSGQPEAKDLELVRIDGQQLWVHCLVSVLPDADHGGERIEGVLYDITQRKLAEKSAQYRAEHDALTGLKSRSFIESWLDQRINPAEGEGKAVTLLFIDLDGFKGVNDRWGHAAGDAVLVEVAHRLRALFKRGEDIVGRLGGDELMVVMDGLQATDPLVHELAQQLIARLREPIALPNGEFVGIGASVGVASYPRNATTARTLIKAADAAMYACKQSGKGNFVIATDLDPHAHGQPVPDARAAAHTEMHDPLTGLPDRRQLVERLEEAHTRVRRSGQLAAVICLDIDQFKTVNVARGTHVGDELLRETARRLRAAVRGDDVTARTGSDEFICVVNGCGADPEQAVTTALRVAHKLLEVVATPLTLSTGTLSVRARAGLSLIDAKSADPQSALREAQLALRRSKSDGAGSVAVFEGSMMVGLHDRLALEQDLKHAIGTAQFSLHIQPQVDAQGRLYGGEGLLRWNHPERGSIAPDRFIPLAEDMGCIVPLGRWVLREGCMALAHMQRAGHDLRLSLNISALQFQHADFVDHVREALADSGAQADRLVLEITESLLISQIDMVIVRMRQLVDMGVRFSIDDFGTGFSSLSYLRRLPLYEIKIDRSFIAGLLDDDACGAIVQSILAMGAHLKLHVVAEGVETEAHARFLRQHGCDSQQGWLYGKPMPLPKWYAMVMAQQPRHAALPRPGG